MAERDNLPHVAPFKKAEYEEFMRDLQSPQEMRDKARITQDAFQVQIKEQGGVGKNPTDANFHSGQNAAKDMSNDRPTVVKRVKDKSYVRRD